MYDAGSIQADSVSVGRTFDFAVLQPQSIVLMQDLNANVVLDELMLKLRCFHNFIADFLRRNTLSHRPPRTAWRLSTNDSECAAVVS
jgi:hypothetical protein